MGNLTSLTEVELGNNDFHGQIPQEFGRLQQLQHLNLSINSFDGEITANLSHCTKLIRLSVAINNLTGKIPDQFAELTSLEILKFSGNNFTGNIPPWIGNISTLSSLSFAGNNFYGSIPSEIGRLSRLQLLTFYDNKLTGRVPSSIYNITSLTDLYFTHNRLQGNIPQNIGFTLPNLRVFFGSSNKFMGPFPASLANASRLRIVDFSENSLTGMPGNLGNLRNLERLNLDDNKLGCGDDDLNFIGFLANCTSLKVLGLGGNYFGGIIPPFIGNLSTQLTALTLGSNLLIGSIPSEIENLINLKLLDIAYNYVNGSVPHNIGKLQNLATLKLNGNKLSNLIPASIGNLTSLTKLFMHNNRLEGNIPPCLGKSKNLQVLDLSYNKLNGTIPKEILLLSSLSNYLSLHHNSLTGPLHSEVGELASLTMLDLSENKLSGEIPSELGQCISMVRLHLGVNQFEGTIPQAVEDLRGLEELNFSRNHLSGKIPKFLGHVFALQQLDLSYNNFEGEVPTEGVFSNSTMISISGNNNLCDGLQELHLPPCQDQTQLVNADPTPNLVSLIMGTGAIFVTALGIFSACFVRKSRKNASSQSSDSPAQISYLELSKSTNGFSEENLIGSGSFGSVYRGIFPYDGSIVAIKVLNLHQQGASKSFIDEFNAMKSIRHRNLLRIKTSCSSTDENGNEFKALVFDFMSNGNLDFWLHPENHGKNQRKRLSLIQRLNIAIDIANALNYLHTDCETPIVHCDLKPSNVLLDNHMVAHVGDFGLARFILEGPKAFSRQTLTFSLTGSIGYIPPECGTGGSISVQGDIYSYGILLLEMIIGKRPTDEIFCDGLSIRLLTSLALLHHAMKIVDPSLLSEETCKQEENEDEIPIVSKGKRRKVEQWRIEEILVSIMRIGLSCSCLSATERMSMNAVVNHLQAIRSSYLKLRK